MPGNRPATRPRAPPITPSTSDRPQRLPRRSRPAPPDTISTDAHADHRPNGGSRLSPRGGGAAPFASKRKRLRDQGPGQEVDLVAHDAVEVRVEVRLEVAAVVGADFRAGDSLGGLHR